MNQTSRDQRVTLNETTPSAASYDTAVEFLRNSCYGSRHNRESGELHAKITLGYNSAFFIRYDTNVPLISSPCIPINFHNIFN